jgi:protein TonB
LIFEEPSKPDVVSISKIEIEDVDSFEPPIIDQPALEELEKIFKKPEQKPYFEKLPWRELTSWQNFRALFSKKMKKRERKREQNSMPNIEEKTSSSPQGNDQATVRSPPEYAENPPPAYPELARQMGYEGLVILKVRVSRHGTCLAIEVRKSSGYEVLDKAAREAVKRWKFKPAMADGSPVEGEVEIPIRFKLTD